MIAVGEVASGELCSRCGEMYVLCVTECCLPHPTPPHPLSRFERAINVMQNDIDELEREKLSLHAALDEYKKGTRGTSRQD